MEKSLGKKIQNAPYSPKLRKILGYFLAKPKARPKAQSKALPAKSALPDHLNNYFTASVLYIRYCSIIFLA